MTKMKICRKYDKFKLTNFRKFDKLITVSNC